MTLRRTSASIFALVVWLSSQAAPAGDTTQVAKAPVMSSLSVQADLVGLGQQLAGSKFANMEAAVKVGFRNRFFPLAEVGVGHGKREGQANTNRFETTAPYFRLGLDYNFNYKKQEATNRFFGGLRYGWSAFKYDFHAPDFADPVWGVARPLLMDDQRGRAQWVEFVAGVETRLWSFVHLGWNIRFKSRLSSRKNPYGQPWYIPGYGRNSSTMWGGTVNLVFDIETKWTKKKK